MKPSYNKVARQAAAKVRAERYTKLTTQQKLQVLDATQGPDGGARQRARLMQCIAAENIAVVAKAEAKKNKASK